MKPLVLVAAPMLALAACSGGEEAAPEAEPTQSEATTLPRLANPVAPASAQPRVLSLEGLADLRIGAPVPQGGNWAAPEVQAGDGCTMYTSPDFPDTWAMVTGGLVRRISAGPDSDVRLIEGIGAGASEAEVRSYFGGFEETPHKYEEVPAKYLTAPNADSGDPALRFEIGADGTVSEVHVGTMPELGFVEGCA